jgi:ribosomal protein S10
VCKIIGATPILVKVTKQKISLNMLVKMKIYKIPTRTLPFKIESLRAGTITKRSAELSIIRSPHIDKKSREQFKFFSQKNTIILREPGQKQYHDTLKFAKLIKTFFATVRITLNICYFHKFTTRF